MTITEWEAVLALPVEPARDHIRGSLDAPVSLVEYGDYECPYCGAAYPIVDVRSGSIKRVASAVGEGAMAVRFVHARLEGRTHLE